MAVTSSTECTATAKPSLSGANNAAAAGDTGIQASNERHPSHKSVYRSRKVAARHQYGTIVA